MKSILKKLIEKKDLEKDEVFKAIELALKKENPVQIGAFLALMEAKNITPDELFWALEALESHARFFDCPYETVDIVGTGGDHANTFNISTGSAILSAACGLKIAKHGNRAATSQCGSADVLEELGIHLDASKEDLFRCLDKANIGFMFAQTFNPAIRSVKEVRSMLGVRTFFNLMGPLLNPAKAHFMIVGVYDESLMDLISKVLLKRGKVALVVCSDGVDEITTALKAKVHLVKDGVIKKSEIDPEALGFKVCTLDHLRGKDKAYNAKKLIETLQGKKGPWADTLVLNVACALELCGKVSSLKEGVALAKQIHEEGRAFKVLQEWIKCSKEKR